MMNAMDDATIARYQQGGDIYNQLVDQYGVSGADSVAAAAATGDNNGEVQEAIAMLRIGPKKDTSTLDIFAEQIVTNPLAAPADALNDQLRKFSKNLFGAIPWQFWIIILIALFFWMVGLSLLKGRLAKA
jgi:hypothetical protein